MATWKSYRVEEIIEKLDNEEFVLPVIQRRLVWDEEQIELLFDTILKEHSFGAIMTLKDFAGQAPLFEFRSFIKDFTQKDFIFSRKVEILSKDISYVVDGQQRLSAIYIGLTGSYNSKYLYFDLLSDWEHNDYYFQFASDESKELKQMVDASDGMGKRRTLWYRVKDLYERLKNAGGQYRYIINPILNQYNDKNFTDEEKERVRTNIENFTHQIFSYPTIGVCEVLINKDKDIHYNRREAVELFRRLNQGGTKLEAIELMASVLKGFSAENERFLYEDINGFSDLKLKQDEIIKLIFILQDNHIKELSDLEQNDSDFIQRNRDRILNSLMGTRQFLIASGLYNFFTNYDTSVIPLYFITYHLFHKKDVPTDEICNYFNDVENNLDYKRIYRWIYLSLLNGVFRSKGAGWIPYKTGIRKILEVMKNNKNKEFPTDEIFNVYETHPLNFKRQIDESYLDYYDFWFVMYIIYGKNSKFRKEDIDHIHPESILRHKGVLFEDINTIANKQLLDYGTNRWFKTNKELKDFIGSLPNKADYLKRHLIPDNEDLWSSDNFDIFIAERKKLIKIKLENELHI